ncbi:DUF4112 domain-containing protein [Thalassobaculum litoreum]|uniref:DUF4112 domain-containing protein n=1 Tax=Thalassobaculum litoreum DSM 18839 TaxID=1123362 RepID=A0A8G2F440_9PROT|nr:DUF4112 domain-containing protein [Thalassobaculum litoreum]SDG05523.1 protein of unknown function [Thalassobaculum litoreum DSM 18839]
MTTTEASEPFDRVGRTRPASGLNRELDRLDGLADLMDSRFRLPRTSIRFGLDALVGLIPGVGDGLVTLPAFYILARAHRLGAPTSLLVRMAANVGIDFLIGAIPLIGDLLDVGYRANRRNVALLREHFVKTGQV